MARGKVTWVPRQAFGALCMNSVEAALTFAAAALLQPSPACRTQRLCGGGGTARRARPMQTSSLDIIMTVTG